MTDLYPHQKEAVEKLKTGSILCGGVGTGKSLTALYYYVHKTKKAPLYIITTARKRDTQDWEKEASPFSLSFTVDSWNNIKKYSEVKHAFFIFDEQRVIGSGAWVRAFLKIAKYNDWILLSATPGDTWMDYVPVFIANGFYRNRTDFINQHVIYSRFTKYPKIDRYVNTGKLIRQRIAITVNMEYTKKTIPHIETVFVPFDKDLIKHISLTRWNPYDDCPIRDAGGLYLVARRVVNSDARRIESVKNILLRHSKAIIFYNFNFELELLRIMAEEMNIRCAEWNGHKHEPIPDSDRWVYLVQYTAGAEGWNCVETDTMIFYSLHYAYRVMDQAAGRIDRLNTPFTDLYYYHLTSRSWIDLLINRALRQKEDFNKLLRSTVKF